MALDQSPEAKVARKARWKRLSEDPETIETVYDHVASGGSIVDLAEAWDIRFVDLLRWIESDETRNKRYTDSVAARSSWTDEMLLGELRLMSRFNIKRLYNTDGSLKKVTDLDNESARMVQLIEVDELFAGTGEEKTKIGETKKIKLWDKLKSIEMHMKNRRLLVDKHEFEGSIKLEDLVGRSMEPAPSPENKAAEPVTPVSDKPKAEAASSAAPQPSVPLQPAAPAAEVPPAPPVSQEPPKQ